MGVVHPVVLIVSFLREIFCCGRGTDGFFIQVFVNSFLHETLFFWADILRSSSGCNFVFCAKYSFLDEVLSFSSGQPHKKNLSNDEANVSTSYRGETFRLLREGERKGKHEFIRVKFYKQPNDVISMNNE